MTSDAHWPNTRWTLISAAQKGDASAVSQLMKLYWKPVYWYARRLGRSHHDAADRTQDFFLTCLRRSIFTRADPHRGKLRSLLLTSLKHLMRNRERDDNAPIRWPTRGVVSLDELMDGGDLSFVPGDSTTPEDAFHQVWTKEQVERVLRLLEQECQMTGNQHDFEAFKKRVIEPEYGAQKPTYRELGLELGKSEQMISNAVNRQRQAFKRLYLEELENNGASKEDIVDELRDVSHLIEDDQ